MKKKLLYNYKTLFEKAFICALYKLFPLHYNFYIVSICENNNLIILIEIYRQKYRDRHIRRIFIRHSLRYFSVTLSELKRYMFTYCNVYK